MKVELSTLVAPGQQSMDFERRAQCTLGYEIGRVKPIITSNWRDSAHLSQPTTPVRPVSHTLDGKPWLAWVFMNMFG